MDLKFAKQNAWPQLKGGIGRDSPRRHRFFDHFDHMVVAGQHFAGRGHVNHLVPIGGDVFGGAFVLRQIDALGLHQLRDRVTACTCKHDVAAWGLF